MVNKTEALNFFVRTPYGLQVDGKGFYLFLGGLKLVYRGGLDERQTRESAEPMNRNVKYVKLHAHGFDESATSVSRSSESMK